ncbi:MAG: methyltransferase domain-containing protein [Pseudomonadota bacterium]
MGKQPTTTAKTGGPVGCGEEQDTTQDGHFGAAYSLSDGEETLAHYRTWAASYDQEVGQDNGYAQPARVADMLARFSDPKSVRVFDAGCGSGLSGVALASAGVTTIDGCDFSPEMLARAKEKGVYTSLFEADLNQPLTRIPDASYDIVTAVGIFSFGHVDPKACEELLRILKPHGHLIVALNDPFWQKGDLRAQLEAMIARGVATEKAKEFGDHLPGHNVMGWVIALQRS